MKVAYLVFAYKNPELLKRTIQKLSTPANAFFVHIDRKSPLQAFLGLRGDNVFFCKNRIPVYWAEFSGVEAILMLAREALQHSPEYDYCVLLSGSEYPLRSSRYINYYLDANRGCEYINLTKMPAPGKPMSRINTIRYPSDQPVRRFVSRALARCGFANRDFRKYFGGLQPYSGITWWGLSRPALEYVLAFTDRHPQLVTYFKNVFAPEETFIHTILGNSPFLMNVRRNLLYEDWSAQGAHPEMISDRHIAQFEHQDRVWSNDVYGPGELLFARKFCDDNHGLLSRIDEMIDRKEASLELRSDAVKPATSPNLL